MGAYGQIKLSSVSWWDRVRLLIRPMQFSFEGNTVLHYKRDGRGRMYIFEVEELKVDLGRKMRVIVTGSVAEFRKYCREHGISNPEGDLFTRLAWEPSKLQGLRECEVVYYGKYWCNPLFGHHILEDIQRDA